MELAIAYYSLALSYTPPNERDLRATILSNRSLMYKKTGKDEEALRDAQQCVQNNPNWAKVTKSVHLAIRLSFLFNLASHGTPNVAGGKAMRFVISGLARCTEEPVLFLCFAPYILNFNMTPRLYGQNCQIFHDSIVSQFPEKT